MKTTTIKTGSVAEFMEEGRMIARLIDQQLPLPELSSISFEDPEDLLVLLRTDNLALFRALKQQPDSLSGIAARLQRDPDAVRHDVDELARLGIVSIAQGTIQLTAQKFKLEADLV